MLENSGLPSFDSKKLRSVAGLGAMTRLTELHIRVPFVNKQEDLQGLTRLQRLTLNYEPENDSSYPFVFPEAARITKLGFYIGEEAHEVSITSIHTCLLPYRVGAAMTKIAALRPLLCLV